jgi:hypothetical protein
MSTQSILVSISIAWSSVFLAAIIKIKTQYATSEHMAMSVIKRIAMWILAGTIGIAQLFLLWWLVEQFVADSPVSTHRLLLIILAMFSIFFTIFFIVIDRVYGGPLAIVAGVMRVLVEDLAKRASKVIKKDDA